MSSEYERGFAAGYVAALSPSMQKELTKYPTMSAYHDSMVVERARKPKKRKQSGKQRILTQMAKKAWDKYKKGSGKKSYIDIRAQVSRSQAYKKATKGM